MKRFVIAFALSMASVVRAATPGWPPEPLVEMRVQAAPSAFPSAGRTYLVYELRLTNLSNAALGVQRVEVRDADNPAAAPIASFEDTQLDQVLQHFTNPAVGDLMPEAVAGHRSLAAGESAMVFLTVVLEPAVRVPDRLSHRLFTDGATIDGAIASTHATTLQVLGPPLEGGSWQANSGAGKNTSHHRRQIFVLGGQATLPNRNAIDWVRVKNGASYSGPANDTHSYYSYGSRVLAVAKGTVVGVRDGIPDNTPGHTGAESLKLTLETIGGNFVVLDLGQGQFAFYGHLQPGSLRVKVGQRVRRGEPIALVGNTGSSFEPHLHFEVTTSPIPMRGEGLPYLLDEYQALIDGIPQRRRRELPIEGTIVEFAAAAPTPAPGTPDNMVWIPPGSFTMGSPASELARHADESPQTRVTLTRGFWLGKTHVTIAQWKAVMGRDVRAQLLHMIDDDVLYDLGGKRQTKRAYMHFSREHAAEYLFNEGADLPMYFVSWDDAVEFCRRLNALERAAGRLPAGYEYDLPTEAQWEYAARAGTSSATYAEPLDAIAWYAANSAAGPRAVATRLPNHWGLYDMAGNVWQWCRDWYGPYPGGEVVDPTGPASGNSRVNRGGSFGSSAGDERSASRAGNPAAEASAYRGFRLALVYRQ